MSKKSKKSNRSKNSPRTRYTNNGTTFIQNQVVVAAENVDSDFNLSSSKENSTASSGSEISFDTDYDQQDLVENVFKNHSHFNYVLVTDDNYSQNSIASFGGLENINWSLIIDLGEDPGERFVFNFLLKNAKEKSVVDISHNSSIDTFSNTINVLDVRKDSSISNYTYLWAKNSNYIKSALKNLIEETRKKPVIIIFDTTEKSVTFREKFITSLLDFDKFPIGSKIVFLRHSLTGAVKEDVQYLDEQFKIKFYQFDKISLSQVGMTYKKFFPKSLSDSFEVILPSLNDGEFLSERDLAKFGTTLELVYSGCEKKATDKDSTSSPKESNEENDFYRGKEATWNDIATNKDLYVLGNDEYNKKLLELEKFIENSARVKSARILHHAGAGGTTLSKRILWDLKSIYPCARLIKYNNNAANLIIELCQRTAKTVILSVEEGSTIIGETDIKKLAQTVNAANCKLVLLRVQRNKNNDQSSGKSIEEKIFTPFKIFNMEQSVAEDFKEKFSKLTTNIERQKMLNSITIEEKFSEQKSPFFYGFYTYQEDYILDNIYRTVSECNPEEKQILSDLALVTIYSQNVCISFYEICERLNISEKTSSINDLSPAIHKLITEHSSGYRICHPIIAKHIIELIYKKSVDNRNVDYTTFVYTATKSYIENLNSLYGSDNRIVDDNLKELIIDRAYIDIEDRKTKFSDLVESISNRTDQEKLFDLLIKRFPNNPHYYNHLARLTASYSGNDITPLFDKAIEYAKKAVEIAIKCDFDVSFHYTTLGCIYSQKIVHYLKSQKKNIMDNIKNHPDVVDNSETYPLLIKKISSPCYLAEEAFNKAREYIKFGDNFNFFPQINMELQVILLLRQCDKEQRTDSKSLIDSNSYFREWYNEHFSIATELFISMKKFTNKEDVFVKEAQRKIELACANYDRNYFINQLSLISNSLINSDNRKYGRSLLYSVYIKNGSTWENLPDKTLILTEQFIRNNLLTNDAKHTDYDVLSWFEIYRQTKSFEAETAQKIISDYMSDSYRKEYLLFIMTFLLLEKNQAIRQDVEKHITEMHRMAKQSCLNTIRAFDVYYKDGRDIGVCPLISNKSGIADSAKKRFTGTILEVDQTHGKISMDELNIDVQFIPKPNNQDKDDSLRETFTRDDIGCNVEFTLMFSYSGLRAFNPQKIQ